MKDIFLESLFFNLLFTCFLYVISNWFLSDYFLADGQIDVYGKQISLKRFYFFSKWALINFCITFILYISRIIYYVLFS